LNDVAIPLAHNGRALVLPALFNFEFADAEPRAFVEFTRGRYLACLFQPQWGFIFDKETESQ
jgi:hypothetical protein